MTITDLIDAAHAGAVKPLNDQQSQEVITLLLAIKENLHEEGLHKILMQDDFHLKILDNPAFDYCLMVFNGHIILTVPDPRNKLDDRPNGGTLLMFELADPKVFEKVAAATRDYHGP